MKNKFLLVVFALALPVLLSAQGKIDTQSGSAKPVVIKPVASHNDAKVSYYLNENFDAGIPAAWTVTDGFSDGVTWTDTADYNTGTLDGTPFVMCDSDGNSSATFDEYLESPAFDASAATALMLSFDQYFNVYDADDTCQVDVWNGSAWIRVFNQFGSDIGTWGAPDNQLIDITAHKNAAMKIRFHYETVTTYQWYWAVDNAQVFSPDAHDLSVLGIAPLGALAGSYTPNVNLFNNGASTEAAFDVKVVIKQGATEVYNQTLNLTGQTFASATALNVAMTTPWTAVAGVYDIQAIVICASDADNTNDTIEDILTIMAYPTYTDVAYAVNGSKLSFNTVNLTTGVLDSINTFAVTDFPMALEFVGDIMYVFRNSGLVEIVAADGTTLPVGTMSVAPVGATYDASTGKTYVVDYDGANANLYELNINTLGTTLIGTSAVGIMIAIEATQTGDLYGVNISDDNLYSIDIATGAGTIIGATGLDLNYGQDISWDKNTNTLYGMLYDGTAQGVFGTIDVTTGTFTNISSPVDQIAAFAVNSTLIGMDETASNHVAVFPNPTSNNFMVSIEATSLMTISDLTGRVVLTSMVENGQTISVEGFEAGVYVVSFEANGVVSNTRLIVR